MLGQFGVDQSRQAVADPYFFDLQAIEERPQGVSQLQRSRGGGEAARQVIDQLVHQPGEFKAPLQGIDGGGQVQRQIAWLERRLPGFQVAEGPHLRRQDGLSARGLDEGVGQGARAASGRRQDHGVRQRLRTQGRERVKQALGQILCERPVRRNVEPPRTRPVEEVGHASRASAASRAAGSPTCIQKPSIGTP